jgi:hypothetical protein
VFESGGHAATRMRRSASARARETSPPQQALGATDDRTTCSFRRKQHFGFLSHGRGELTARPHFAAASGRSDSSLVDGLDTSQRTAVLGCRRYLQAEAQAAPPSSYTTSRELTQNGAQPAPTRFCCCFMPSGAGGRLAAGPGARASACTERRGAPPPVAAAAIFQGGHSRPEPAGADRRDRPL